MSSIVTIKTNLAGVLRRISVDTAKSSWSDVEARIRALYGLADDAAFSVSYVDEDGDSISISTTEEVRDLARAAPKTLKFDISLGSGDASAWVDAGKVSYPEVPKVPEPAAAAEVPKSESEAVPASETPAAAETATETAAETASIETKTELPAYTEEPAAVTETETTEQQTKAAETTETKPETEQPAPESTHDPLANILEAFAGLASTVIDEVTRAVEQAQQQAQAQQQQTPEPRPWFGVVCDGCNTTPIVGHRFKCNVCPDYDLCATCFTKVDEIHTVAVDGDAEKKKPASHSFADLGDSGRRNWRRHGHHHHGFRGPRPFFPGFLFGMAPPPPFGPFGQFFAPPPPPPFFGGEFAFGGPGRGYGGRCGGGRRGGCC